MTFDLDDIMSVGQGEVGVKAAAWDQHRGGAVG